MSMEETQFASVLNCFLVCVSFFFLGPNSLCASLLMLLNFYLDSIS